MVNIIDVAIATEDELSEAVVQRLLLHFGKKFSSSLLLRRNGFGYLKSNIQKFIELSHSTPVILVTDLDRKACPLVLKEEWLGAKELPAEFLFCIAVREIEAWLLSDAIGVGLFLGLRNQIAIRQPEAILDPKKHLLELAKKGSRDAREALLPEKGSSAVQGLGYNNFLKTFVNGNWSVERASANSPSLQRAINKLAAL